jgi:Protein of unknown function (DUF1257)
LAAAPKFHHPKPASSINEQLLPPQEKPITREGCMSKYDQFATVMKDESLLVSALQDLGHTVDVHREGIHIRGYWTDAIVPEPVHIVIRAATRCTSYASDIGFTRLPDGTYRVHVNDMDREYGRAWLGRVQQRYKERATVQMAQRKGYIFRGREVIQTERGEQVKLLFGTR